MLLQYASDLHLEFPENKAYIKANPIIPKGEILLLAGDLLPFILIDKHNDFFDYVSDYFQHTYWIPGNHEYYHFDAATKCGTFCEKIRSNVSLVNNWSVKLNDTLVVFSTLWSKISPQHQWDIEKGVNDFRIIKYDGHRFSFEQYNQLHTDSLNYIQNELSNSEPGIKKVVVTHHVPTYQHYPEQYKGSVLSEAFAVELSDMIETTKPDFWIYGHHHINTPDFKIDQTHLITNQMGYVRYKEHLLFKTDKTILL